jgi:ankyrin repeat protein
MPIARILLDAGAGFGTPSHRPYLRTVMKCAVIGNCITLVQLPIAKGVNPDARAPDVDNSLTALEEASSRWPINIEILSALIDAGADVNKIACSKASLPLLLAAAKGNVEAVQLLLRAGACPNLISEDQETVRQVATRTWNVGLIELLLDAGADVNAPAGPRFSRAALQSAAEGNNIDILKLLLSHGADVNAPAGHSYGIAALHGAVITGNLKIVLTLLKAGAQINAPPAEREGRMALQAAAEHGRLNIAVPLLKNDDDDESEAIDLRCKRAAKLAAANGHYLIARILREHKTC